MGLNSTRERYRRRQTRNIDDDIYAARRDIAGWEQKLDSATNGLGLSRERLDALELLKKQRSSAGEEEEDEGRRSRFRSNDV